mmetsp:Transcript_41148/g.46454  ORF Transcript_41148/g.46454 Transcript_41148/m.46454 type:complete len:134 (+) Transcript_41148:196-597(+)
MMWEGRTDALNESSNAVLEMNSNPHYLDIQNSRIFPDMGGIFVWQFKQTTFPVTLGLVTSDQEQMDTTVVVTAMLFVLYVVAVALALIDSIIPPKVSNIRVMASSGAAALVDSSTTADTRRPDLCGCGTIGDR